MKAQDPAGKIGVPQQCAATAPTLIDRIRPPQLVACVNDPYRPLCA
jgi:hypothetical protein